jgi:hypothetical protein
MPNIELLDLTLWHIENNPETWNQGEWRCGTSYCFAGHAALLSGWVPVGEDTELYWRLHGWESEERAVAYLTPLAEREKRMEQTLNISLFWGKRLEMVGQHVPNTSDVVSKDGEQRSIALVAAEELDLDEYTANILFHSGNTLDGIRNKVQRIKEHGHLSFDDWD